MVEPLNHYQVLEVTPQATPQEIKQAYRRLAKRYHPDTNDRGDRALIVAINAAYEVLRDPQQRQHYNDRLNEHPLNGQIQQRWERTAQAQADYQRRRRRERSSPMERSQWLKQVYQPINQRITPLLRALGTQIDALAADPFDDQLMAEFLTYVQQGKTSLAQAQELLAAQPNPVTCAHIAKSLYYCLNQLSDGLDELERFSLSYDEHYLHVGTELFRIAYQLQHEAHAAVHYLG